MVLETLKITKFKLIKVCFPLLKLAKIKASSYLNCFRPWERVSTTVLKEGMLVLCFSSQVQKPYIKGLLIKLMSSFRMLEDLLVQFLD